MDKSSYVKHFLIMFSGTILAQFVNLTSYPFLTRLYTPEDFGFFSIFLSTSAAIGILSCGRYDAVIQASRFHERFAVFKVSQVVNVIVSLTFTIIFVVISYTGVAYFNSVQALLLGLSILLTGFSNAASLLLLKHEFYKASSWSVVLRTLLTALPQIVFFYLFEGPMGLICGFVVGFLAQAVYLLLLVKQQTLWRKSSLAQLKVMAYKYRHFFQIDVPSQLLSVMSLHLLSYLLLFLYTSNDVGLYSMAFRLASLPLAMFSASLSQVFFQKASKSYCATGVFWLEMRLNLAMAACLGLVIFSVLIAFSEVFIAIYLGEAWSATSDILVALSPMIAANFVYSTISVAPLVIGRPKILLLVRLGLCGVMVGAFLVSYFQSLPITEYLLLHSFMSCFIYLVFIVSICLLVKKQYG
jgi:O-antigen/teichoic acid export membrane protein